MWTNLTFLPVMHCKTKQKRRNDSVKILVSLNIYILVSAWSQPYKSWTKTTIFTRGLKHGPVRAVFVARDAFYGIFK